jgi:aryl-alcohol dehydrogenase-like predicted oxidoreductase
VESTWNLLDRSAGPALEAARKEGLGVLIKEALANGRLTDRGDVPQLAAAARLAGTTPDALALSAVLAQPWVDVALSGATTVPEIESNLTARSVEPGPDALELLDAIGEDADTYWHKRSQLPWN